MTFQEWAESKGYIVDPPDDLLESPAVPFPMPFRSAPEHLGDKALEAGFLTYIKEDKDCGCYFLMEITDI